MQQGARGRQRQQGDHARARGRGTLGCAGGSDAHEDVILVRNLNDRRLVRGLEGVAQHVPDNRRGRVNRDTAVHDNVRAGQQQVAGQGHVRLRRGQADAARKTGCGQRARATGEGQAGKGTKTHGVLFLSSRCPEASCPGL